METIGRVRASEVPCAETLGQLEISLLRPPSGFPGAQRGPTVDDINPAIT